MSTSDVLAVWSLVVGVVGTLVTTVGFVVAIIQIRRTANATIATQHAIEQANRRMLYNHLLVLLPQLRNLEADLDAAIAGPDRLAAIRSLVAFSHTANQVAALLETDSEGHLELIAQLRSTSRSASVAKAELVSGTKRSLKVIMQDVAVDVSTVAAACAGLATTYQAKVA